MFSVDMCRNSPKHKVGYRNVQETFLLIHHSVYEFIHGATFIYFTPHLKIIGEIPTGSEKWCTLISFFGLHVLFGCHYIQAWKLPLECSASCFCSCQSMSRSSSTIFFSDSNWGGATSAPIIPRIILQYSKTTNCAV